VYPCLIVVGGTGKQGRFPFYKHDALKAALLGEVNGNSGTIKSAADNNRIL
jgi:hypothetical protein